MPITSEISVKPQAFASAVAWAAKWLATKPNVPAHAGLSLTSGDGSFVIGAFGENVSARAVVPVEGLDLTSGPQRAIVSGRLLAELAGTFPAGKPVVITGDGANVVITAGRFTVTLPAMNEDDYPALPGALPTIGTVGGDALAAAVARVGAAAGRDPSKGAALASMYLGFGEKTITITGTDRNRAATLELAWTPNTDTQPISATPLASVLIDAAAAFGGPDVVAIGCDGRLLSFTSPTRSMVVNLIDIGGDGYPVHALRPSLTFEQAQTLVIDPADLVIPLKRAVTVRGKDGPVRMSISEGTLAIGALEAESKRSSDDEVDVTYSGPAAEIAVKPEYLADALHSAPGPVILGFGVDRKPITLRSDADPSWRHVLMPVVVR